MPGEVGLDDAQGAAMIDETNRIHRLVEFMLIGGTNSLYIIVGVSHHQGSVYLYLQCDILIHSQQ